MKKILVTGGSGFIGSHLCDALLEKGNSVICVDNLSTGRKENISHLLSNRNFSFIEQDICSALEFSGIDEIYNLASPASPSDFPRMPVAILETSSLGLKNVLELALKKSARFLQASTSEVYGQPLEHPQKESYFGNVNPIGERSCYDEAKRFAEALTMAYHRKHGLDSRIVRIFNTYGTRMRAGDGRIIPTFVTQCLNNKPITVYGNGSQTRCYCYVTDLVDGLMMLMGSSYNAPVNIGSSEEMTVLEVAEKIRQLTNSGSELVFKPLPEDDPTRRKPDTSLAERLLNWKPKVSFEQGLEETIEYFRKKAQKQ